MKKLMKKNYSILLFLASAVVVMVIAWVSINMMYESAKMIEETSSNEMLAYSKAASLLVSADKLDEFMTAEDMNKPEYAELYQRLVAFTQENGLEYTYFLRLNKETNRMEFIIDNSEEGASALSSIEPVERETSPDLALTGVANVVPLGTYSDGYHGYISAFAPVYYEDGSLSNIVAGVDMIDVYIKTAQDNVKKLAMVLACSLIVVLGTCLFTMMLYRNKARQAEAASVSKSSFLSNMSHEIRTPMNAILGMAEIARNSDDITKVQYCLDKIDDAAAHLLGVINDILDISKIEAGKFTLSNEQFSMEKMLQRVTTVINYKVDEKKQTFLIKMDRDVPEFIYADRQRLSQVITNLLSNAMKFTPEGGQISVLIHKTEEEEEDVTLQFEIIDTGIGISKEQQQNLFQSFVQADNSISRRFGGTGLGLTISKNIVNKMGGRIWVTSEMGEGSNFSFEVKVKKIQELENLAQDNEILLKNIKVLVVDDAPEIREYFADISSRIGILCDVAESGEQALELLKENSKSYHLIFVDYMMPNMDGITLTKKIREQYGSKGVVIMISAVGWSQIEEEATKAGVDQYLAKPLFKSYLVECINKYMSKEAYEVQKEEKEHCFEGIFAGKHILLAEDVEINREIATELLEQTGVLVEAAEDGQMAIEMFQANPDKYDLILMDIHMPRKTGYEATREIRSLTELGGDKIPIVAMTANVFKEDVEQCLAAGMNDHVGKPIEFEEVVKKIKKHI
ncbi:response regulator [Lachnospiraceae bacterium OttesenSCG-928-D06]|nr:response regulator [Lachnospiraceae bacterium OttesenSCG-928-D06]